MYFEIYRSTSNGQYWAIARGGNNEKVWQTEMYTTKQSAINAVHMLQTGAAAAPIYDRT